MTSVQNARSTSDGRPTSGRFFSSSHSTFSQSLKSRQILPVAARTRHRDRRFLYLALFAFLFAGVVAFLKTASPLETGAASLDHFDPGNIITDYNMSNYNSMTESDIQNFLNSKVACNRPATAAAIGALSVEPASEGAYNYRFYFRTSSGGIASALYHTENGYFVCLKNEKFNEKTGLPDKTGETAAHIIYTIAQEYKINPQVLLVLLQKEQGLITDDFPNHIQYRSATGYGCPDTAACDTKYYGFRNQVSNAAKLFRTVLDGGWTNYPLGNNYVQYNPNSACGGSTVNIKNLATSSLYRYTPYQPNSAALKAGYSTVSDGCASYGNRNFFLYFSDWFSDWFSDPTDDSNATPKGASETKPIETKSVETKATPAAMISYQSHLADIGWESKWAENGAISGTTGQARRLEAVYIKPQSGKNIQVLYQSHLADIGWESKWAENGAISGTTGQARRLEAIKIKLDDTSAKAYDIYYRSHVENYGWLAWTKNGEPSGSEGKALRLEALEVVVVKKGDAAPVSSDQNTTKTFVK